MGPPCSGSPVLGDGASSVVLVGAWAHGEVEQDSLASPRERNEPSALFYDNDAEF